MKNKVKKVSIQLNKSIENALKQLKKLVQGVLWY